MWGRKGRGRIWRSRKGRLGMALEKGMQGGLDAEKEQLRDLREEEVSCKKTGSRKIAGWAGCCRDGEGEADKVEEDAGGRKDSRRGMSVVHGWGRETSLNGKPAEGDADDGTTEEGLVLVDDSAPSLHRRGDQLYSH